MCVCVCFLWYNFIWSLFRLLLKPVNNNLAVIHQSRPTTDYTVIVFDWMLQSFVIALYTWLCFMVKLCKFNYTLKSVVDEFMYSPLSELPYEPYFREYGFSTYNLDSASFSKAKQWIKTSDIFRLKGRGGTCIVE